MKNFWLDRKPKTGVSILSMSGHTFTMIDDTNLYGDDDAKLYSELAAAVQKLVDENLKKLEERLGSEVFPPWNTESYNGYDFDSGRAWELDL